MAAELVIKSVALSKRRRSLPDPMDGHRDVWFDVTIEVENGGAKTLHVVDELRCIVYDAATHVLLLRLAEPPPQPVRGDAPTFHLPPPRTLALKPRATATIVVKVPAVLRTMRAGQGFVPTMEETDLRAMRTIRCEVASSERPIEHRGAETAHELRTRLRSWGKVASTDIPVDPDMRDAPTDHAPDRPDPDQSRRQ